MPQPIWLKKAAAPAVPDAVAPLGVTEMPPMSPDPAQLSWLGQKPAAVPVLAEQNPMTFKESPEILSRDEFLAQHPAQVPGRPVGPFDKITDPTNPSYNSWSNRHNKLREGLAFALAGLGEYAGRLDGNPGTSAPFIKNWLGIKQAQRDYNTNMPAMKQKSEQSLYDDYLAQEAKKTTAETNIAHANYFNNLGGKTIPNGYTVGPNGTLIPITSQSAKDQAAITKTEAETAKLGFKSDGKGGVMPMSKDELSYMDGVKAEYMQAQTDMQKASADLASAKNDKNSDWYQLELAKYRMAQQRLSIALGQYSLAMRKFGIDNYGVDPGTSMPGGGSASVSTTVKGDIAANGVPGGHASVATPAAPAPAVVADATPKGTVPPGVTIGRDGRPVGKKFEKNVQPTGTARSAGEYAQSVLDHIDEFESMIRNLDAKGQLGPFMSRFNAYKAGKIGSGDPDYTTLHTFGSLFDTATMKAHFGSKGGSEAMEHFENMINTGRMDGPTLIAALEGVRPYMSEYARLGTIHTSSGKNPVPPSHNNQPGAPRQGKPAGW